MRLTDQDVLNIRHAHHDGDTATDLAAKYRVHVSTITKIVLGDRRAEVGGPLAPQRPKTNKRFGNPKLTPYQVVLMRLKANAGHSRKSLSAEFGVTEACISDIVNGRTYQDLPGPRHQKTRIRKRYQPRSSLTEADVLSIRDRYARGVGTQNSLADEYNVWPVTIGRIVRGETHKNMGGPITHKYKTKRNT